MPMSKVLSCVLVFPFLANSIALTTAFAETEIGSSEGAVQVDISPADSETSKPTELRVPGLTGQKKTRYNFTAAEYFYPIKPDADRSHLPERVTFETVRDMSLEDLKTKLTEQDWKYVFHCTGQAITIRQFSGVNFVDGVVNQSAVNNFSFNSKRNGVLSQTLLPPEINSEIFTEPVTRESSLVIENLDSGHFLFVFKKFSKEKYKLVRVRETGELLLEFEIFSPENYRKICPDGSAPKTLLVPLPNDLTS